MQHIIRRLSPLFLIGAFALALALIASQLPTQAAGAPLTVAAGCNLGQGITIAQGLRHVSAGDATIARDPLTGDLNVTNIGSSGMDGFCAEVIPLKAQSRFFNPIGLGLNGDRVQWDINGRINNGPRGLLASLIVRNNGGPVELVFADGFESGSVVAQVLIGDEVIVETTLPDSGVVATIDTAGSPFRLIEGRFGPGYGEVGGLHFQQVREFTLADGLGTKVDGDAIRFKPVGMQTFVATDDKWTFTRPSIVGNNIAFFDDSLTHTVPSGQVLPPTSPGAINTQGVGGDMGTTQSAPSWTGCLTCTLQTAVPDAQFAIQATSIETITHIYDFTNNFNLATVGDQLDVDLFGSIDLGPRKLIGTLTYERVANGRNICAAYPEFPTLDVRIRATRNGVIIRDLLIGNGDCVTVTQGFSLDIQSVDAWLARYRANLIVQGLSGPIELIVRPEFVGSPPQIDWQATHMRTNLPVEWIGTTDPVGPLR